MTSAGHHGPVKELADPHQSHRAGLTTVERAEHEARARRLLLTGALGAFVAFFALAVAADLTSADGPSSAPAEPVPVVISGQWDDGRVPLVPAPQVRTRSS